MWSALFFLGAAYAIWLVLKSIVIQLFQKTEESKPEGDITAGKAWLEANGYTVLKVDGEAKYVSYIGDDSSISYQERAHFIARKDGYEYAVFVGKQPMDEREIHQRFFPLFTILGVKEIIFLDLTSEKVRHVDFQILQSPRRRFRQWIRRGAWFASGVIFTYAWIHRL